jgi:hypothetical protein
MNTIRHLTKTRSLVMFSITFTFASSLSRVGNADFLPVYGGPTYSSATGGYLAVDVGHALYPDVRFNHVNNAGMAAATDSKYDSAGHWIGYRAVRWSATTTATQLDGNPNSSEATGINNSGTVITSAMAWTEGYPPYRLPNYQSRPAKWAASSTAATTMEHPYITYDGWPGWDGFTFLHDMNDSGTAVGQVFKSRFNEFGNPVDEGLYPGRWDATGRLTELGVLGTRSDGWTVARAYAVNAAGVAAGTVTNWNHPAAIGDQFAPSSAVRWEAGAIEATELQPLATTGNQYSATHASAINDAGMVVGGGGVFEPNAGTVRSAAIRWDAAGNPTELGNIPGTDYSTIGYSPRAINNAGTAVGRSGPVKGNHGSNLSQRAIRWDGSSATATELGHLGTYTDGSTVADAFAVNAAGTAVGRAAHFDAPSFGDYHAVYWAANDTQAIDLNTLIDPASGWVLKHAFDISDTGWIVGVGEFDPDGPDRQSAYPRNFLIHVPATALMPGDFNGNGSVDAADYVVWRKGLGTTYDQNDYGVWRSHFGTSLDSGSGSVIPSAEPLSAAVPEPADALLLLIGATVLLLGYRASRKKRGQNDS